MHLINTKFGKKLLILTLSLSAGITVTHAASFSCDKAKTATEKTICQTRSLNDADVKLVTTYNIVIHAVPMGGRDAEKAAQYQWLKQRDSCRANVCCIGQRYHERQKHLDDIVQNRILTQGPF
ncbi:lysozyme inhibitor LprI family protein [Acinetobacter ihumii]|uniref:lysozyme inhibitor LprI family protein n=1 Tax=Acinetobacter ihumii TaxID=2483802 RepID=UPI001030E511|nr:lysozyme inhibitor LprI family protein [Acinetobacter ihumii]